MTRTETMAERLPPIYDTRPATLLYRLLDHLALPLEVVDEERVRVQRSHWIATATDRRDVARLGALLDRTMEDWEDVDLFRDRVVAIARARLDGGASREPILRYVADLLKSGRDRLAVDIAATGQLRLAENPQNRSRLTVGPMTPLDRFELVNHGLEPATLEATLVGLPGNRAAIPVFAVADTGYLIGWAGTIPWGARLHLRAGGPDGLRAELDGRDRSDRLFSVSDYVAGTPLSPEQLHRPAEPLVLPPGTTKLWHITAGLFDRPAFDAVMFAVARSSLRQGRFDEDFFDEALMYQPPPLWAEFSWTSPAPASFEVRIPAGVMTADPPLFPARDDARQRLGLLIGQGVDELRAVGVRAVTVLQPFTETMPLSDRVVVGAEVQLVDDAPIAQTPPPQFGVLLDETPLDNSRLE
jgi:hypothetical protein